MAVRPAIGVIRAICVIRVICVISDSVIISVIVVSDRRKVAPVPCKGATPCTPAIGQAAALNSLVDGRRGARDRLGGPGAGSQTARNCGKRSVGKVRARTQEARRKGQGACGRMRQPGAATVLYQIIVVPVSPIVLAREIFKVGARRYSHGLGS
jgi:hypothetical protein